MKNVITLQIVREYTLEDLAKICNIQGLSECRKIMEDLGLSTSFQKRLANQAKFFENVNLHKKEMQIAEKTLLQCREQKEQAKNACQLAYQEWQYLEKICKEAYVKYKQEKDKESRLEEEEKQWEKMLRHQSKSLEKMSKYTLLHPSATLKSLDKRVGTALVCTKYDINRMKKLNGFVDSIIDTRTETYDLSMNFPKRILDQFVSEEEFTSAVEYVKMVAKFYLEEKSYHLLYNSCVITAMLEYILGE